MAERFGFVEYASRQRAFDQNVELERIGFVPAVAPNALENREGASIEYLAGRYVESRGVISSSGVSIISVRTGVMSSFPEKLAALAKLIV